MPYFRSYDETRLWFERVGEGAPLVCLAGGPGADVRCLGDLGGLASHRTLVLLDGRAAGRSEVPEDRGSCAFPEQARDVEALRRHLGLGRIDLLAHSAGVLTAQEYAVRYEVSKLVLVCAAGRVAREPDEAETAVIRSSGVATAEPADDFISPPSWLRDEFYASGAIGDAALPGLARRRAMEAPVLALAGSADGIAGTVPSRLIGDCYPNAVVEILPSCGHFPWLDDPNGFCTSVVRFLDE